MAKKILVGEQRWEGYQVLCKPLEVGGVDRRLFGLLIMVFMVFWQGMGSLLLGIATTFALYYLFRVLTKRDPQFFSVLQSASRLPAAWYDPADPPTRYGPYIAPSDEFLRGLVGLARQAEREQHSRSGLRKRAADLSRLFGESSRQE